MIKFRCLKCSMKNLSNKVRSCPLCGGTRFVSEYYNESKDEPRLQPSKFIYESIESNSKEKNQFVVNCSVLNKQKYSPTEGFDFTHNNLNHNERTYFVSHGILYAGSTLVCNQNFPLKEEPSENFCPNFVLHECEKTTIESHGIVNAGSTFEWNQNFPLIKEPLENFCSNFFGHEGEKTTIESHEIVNAGSTFEWNQNFPLIQELSENFCPNFVGHECEKTNIESHGIGNVGSTFACNQNFHLIEEPPVNFCPNFVGHECEKTTIESHWILNAGSTFECNPIFPLIEDPSENFCPKFVGHECERTTSKSHGIANAGSTLECNPNFLLIEEPSENFNPNSVSLECEKTTIESHGIVNAGSTFEWNQNVPLKDEPSENFCPITVGKETIRLDTENSSTIHTYSLNRQDNDNCFSRSSSFFWNHDCVSTTECQDLRNVPHDLQRIDGKSRPSVEMRAEIQIIEESSRIQDIDGKLSSADSSHFDQQKERLQPLSDSLITLNGLMKARAKENSSSLDLLSKTRSSSSQNSQFEDLKSMNEAFQPKVQSSEKKTDAGALESGASKYSSASTSKEVLKCQKCPRWFKTYSLLNVHEQSNCDPKPFKCDKCLMEFRYETQLKNHHPVHREEEPFKCNICRFATKWDKNLKIHLLKMHNINLYYQN